MPDIAPWARQPNEPSKAFMAFATYRDLGPAQRSLDGVTLRLRGEDDTSSTRPPGRRLRTRRIQDLSRTWNWVDRATAFDRHVDAEVQRALLADAVAMCRRHAAQAQALQFRAMQRLAEIDLSELGPRDVLAWLRAGMELEAASMASLTAVTVAPAASTAATIPVNPVPNVIIARTASELALLPADPEQESAAGVLAIPFVPATALAG